MVPTSLYFVVQIIDYIDLEFVAKDNRTFFNSHFIIIVNKFILTLSVLYTLQQIQMKS